MMNQQIENLIEQATCYQWIPGQGTRIDFDKDEFAQLIIRDCAEQLESYSMMPIDPAFYASLLRDRYGVKL